MKFFFRLGFRYGTDEDPYSHTEQVYGPYENDTALHAALARLYPNGRKEEILVFEGQIIAKEIF